MRSELTFRIAISKEEDKWLAMSLEHGIVTQGDSVQAALKELACTYAIRLAVAEKKGIDPFAGLSGPSPVLAEAFERATPVKKPDEFHIPAGLLMSQPSIDVRVMQ